MTLNCYKGSILIRQVSGAASAVYVRKRTRNVVYQEKNRYSRKIILIQYALTLSLIIPERKLTEVYQFVSGL